MSIRIYGKMRQYLAKKQINPFWCDWRPDGDWQTVNITTRSSAWGRALSPMFVGPVELPGVTPAATAANIESAWQYSKVYSVVQDTAGRRRCHLDENLNPTAAWWEFARAGWAETRFSVTDPEFEKWKGVLRHPVSKLPDAKQKAQPAFVWWNGKRISYIEGRQAVYGKLYTDMIVKTEAFARLKGMADCGENIAMFDFDGTDHVGLGRSYESLLNDPSRPFGHGLLLCMLLEGVKLADLQISPENTFAYQLEHGLLHLDEGMATGAKAFLDE